MDHSENKLSSLLVAVGLTFILTAKVINAEEAAAVIKKPHKSLLKM